LIPSLYLTVRGALARHIAPRNPAISRGPRERGQGLVEYALILVLVAIVVIGVLTFMGKQIQNAFQDIVSTLQG
jgi:pilus assembly protein Flp/PilA